MDSDASKGLALGDPALLSEGNDEGQDEGRIAGGCTPSPLEQKAKVDEARCMNDEVQFAIDLTWYESWTRYVAAAEKTLYEEEGSGDEKGFQQRWLKKTDDKPIEPGVFRCSHLANACGQLKLTAREGVDYAIVNESVYQLFKQWYGDMQADVQVHGEFIEETQAVDWRPYLVSLFHVGKPYHSGEYTMIVDTAPIPTSMPISRMRKKCQDYMSRKTNAPCCLEDLTFRLWIRQRTGVVKAESENNLASMTQERAPAVQDDESLWQLIDLSDPVDEVTNLNQYESLSLQTFEHLVDRLFPHARDVQAQSAVPILQILLEYYEKVPLELYDRSWFAEGDIVAAKIQDDTPSFQVATITLLEARENESSLPSHYRASFLGLPKLYDCEGPLDSDHILPVGHANDDWRPAVRIGSLFALRKFSRSCKVVKLVRKTNARGLRCTCAHYRTEDPDQKKYSVELYDKNTMRKNHFQAESENPGSPASSNVGGSLVAVTAAASANDVDNASCLVEDGDNNPNNTLGRPRGNSSEYSDANPGTSILYGNQSYYSYRYNDRSNDSAMSTSPIRNSLTPSPTPGRPTEVPGKCGLTNLGNTCFMNSIIQCLSNTVCMQDFFLDDSYKEQINTKNILGTQGALAHHFARLMQRLWSGHHAAVAPHDLKAVIGSVNPQFRGYRQHDAQELLGFLLDGLHEDLNRVTDKPYVEVQDPPKGTPDADIARTSWDNFKKRNESFIVDHFYGQLRSHLTCNECHFEAKKFDPFLSLSVPLPSAKYMYADCRLSFYGCRNGMVLRGLKVLKQGATVRVLAEAAVKKLKESSGACPLWPMSVDMMDPYEFYRGTIYKRYKPEDLLVEVIENREHLIFMVHTKLIQDEKLLEVVSDPDTFPMETVKMLVGNSPWSRITTQSLTENFTDATGKTLLPSAAAEFMQRYQARTVRVQIVHRKPRLSGAASLQDFWMNTFVLDCATTSTLGTLRHRVFEHLRGGAWESKVCSAMVPPVVMNAAAAASKKRICILDNECAPGSMSTNNANFSRPVKSRRLSLEQTGIVAATSRAANSSVQEDAFERKGRLYYATAHSAARFEPTSHDFADERTFSADTPLGKVMTEMSAQNDILRRHPVQLVVYVDWNSTAEFETYMGCSGFSDYDKHEDTAGESHIREVKKTHTDSALTLEACLDVFSEVEQLGEEDTWYCPQCKNHVQAFKKMDIWSAPQYLVVHLKRFQYTLNRYLQHSTDRRKLDAAVDFPRGSDLLDLTKYIQGPLSEGDSSKYKLYAVSEHSGGLGGGHYTACAFGRGKAGRHGAGTTSADEEEDSWYTFNDSWVHEIEGPEEISQKTAYVLFYKRVDDIPAEKCDLHQGNSNLEKGGVQTTLPHGGPTEECNFRATV